MPEAKIDKVKLSQMLRAGKAQREIAQVFPWPAASDCIALYRVCVALCGYRQGQPGNGFAPTNQDITAADPTDRGAITGTGLDCLLHADGRRARPHTETAHHPA